MASPRPGTSGNSSRPLAYKSPAVKTPASLHGHHVSVSSQPSSTPMAGTAVHDDLLALNSPAAALINSIGTTGLTPLGSATDGLGISTGASGGPVRSIGAPVNPEYERLHRAQLVLNTLKSRLGGHGITREGVERIAQLQGFTTLWDDDNLTIAGNCVDLEINFEVGGGHGVRDVSLKLNLSENATESEEPQFQAQGTKIIKDNLHSQSPKWKSLDAFASNLQYLSQLDRIESGSPCFHAIGNLYSAFQEIWSAEKTRFSGRAAWQHLRQSAVGRPVLDRAPTLGLALDFWGSEHAEGEKIGDSAESDDPAVQKKGGLYTAHISCEAGLPVTTMAKKWVSDRVLLDDNNAMLDEGDTPVSKPDWRDPAQDPESLLEKPIADSNTLGKSADLSSSILNLHFNCAFSPEIYLPLNVAASFNVEIPMINIDQQAALTYQTALQQNCVNGGPEVAPTSSERWLRSLPVPVKGDPDRVRKHSYALMSAQNPPALWCYPIRQLNFTHPRQLAAVVPILRQYIVLWRLLKSLVAYTNGPNLRSSTKPQTAAPAVSSRPMRRSNKKLASLRLEDLLKVTAELDVNGESLAIDLTLDVLSDLGKARLDIYIPLIHTQTSQTKNSFIFLGLSVCQHGVIEVRDLRGISESRSPTSLVQSRMLRILEATEDIGLTVEWLLDQVQRKD
jgi:hypothetical protein